MVSAIVSLATGSSWSTIATIGIALLGIGKAMDMNEGLVAGAIISGAYFGDKMSPLSDTTNLAPAMAGTDLITHIRYMVFTTLPSILITLLIFLGIGIFKEHSGNVSDVAVVLDSIQGAFHITPWLFLVPAAVIFLIVKKVPALPSLLIGALLGGVFALIFQPDVVDSVSGLTEGSFYSDYVGVMKALYTDVSVVTGNAMVDDLLSAGGMSGMMGTIWLILCAMIFGGIMEKSGMLERLSEEVIKRAHSTGSLVASTAFTCGFFNLTASDQYLAIVVPGRMYAKAFRNRGLAPENLSRTLEDSGTVTSVLIPWNTCGAAQSTVLGVATLTYLPYCFFNIISPIMTIIFGAFNIKIRRLQEGQDEKKSEENAAVVGA